MAKQPSIETQLRSTKAELREVNREISVLRTENHKLRIALNIASKDCDEWKARFDRLLERTPKETT